MTVARPSRHPRIIALGIAAVLLLIAAQPALAATWSTEAQITDLDSLRPQIVRTGPASAVIVWQGGNLLHARRTIDGGQTWTPQITLAGNLAVGWSVAASGASVDLVWVRQAPGSPVLRLYYRRSQDGGATWGTPKPLTSNTSRVADAAVARHANGQVSVVFTGLTTGRNYIRTSLDGGTTFAAKKQLGITDNSEPGRTVTFRSDPVVAIAGGITYAAYTSARDRISVRRSATAGRTWSGPTIITNAATGSELSLAAAGKRAVLAYTISVSGRSKVVYRRTVNQGVTWAARKSFVALGAGTFSMSAQLAYKSGVLGVIFKYGKPGASPIWYRESTDFGATWSVRTRVSLEHGPITDTEPGGVAILSGVRLAGYNQNRPRRRRRHLGPPRDALAEGLGRSGRKNVMRLRKRYAGPGGGATRPDVASGPGSGSSPRSR